MKATETFATIIKSELDRIAASDSLFAESLKKPNKTLDGCVNYIINQVYKSGKNGFADQDIFNMATHYYDEDDIKEVGASTNIQKIVTTQNPPDVATKEVHNPRKKMRVVHNQQTLF